MRKNHYYFEVPGSSLGRCNKVPTVPATISVSVSVQKMYKKNIKKQQRPLVGPLVSVTDGAETTVHFMDGTSVNFRIQ